MDEDNGEELKKLSKKLDELSLRIGYMESSIERLWSKNACLNNFLLSVILIFVVFLFRNPIWAFIKFVFLLILGIWGWASSFK